MTSKHGSCGNPKKIVVEDFESWAGAQGVNLSAAENQAGAALRKLKGD